MERNKGIRISEKYGVNPTIPICAWCGKEKNELALLGMLPGDVKAPENLVLDYSPCEECEKKWQQGVTFIEVSNFPQTKGQPPVKESFYPTFRFAVVNEDALEGNFKKGDVAFMLEKDFQETFGNIL